MRTLISSLLFLCFLSSNGISQEQLDFEWSCSYTGEIHPGGVYGFQSDEDASRAIVRIMRYTGLPSNFTIQASNVPNAAAIIQGERRFILYNQYFMERIKDLTKTDWSAFSIMAHEIGHHLSGHTLDKEGSRPKKELEADQFSGFVLYKMGATLEESRAAMEAIASDAGSPTHPPKHARLAAITNGWMQARDLEEEITPINKTTLKPPASPTTTVEPNTRPRSSESTANRDTPPPPPTTAPTPTQPSRSTSGALPFSVHSMIRTSGKFPDLKDELKEDRYYLDGFKINGRWGIITGPQPADFEDQEWITKKSFPAEDIKRLWDDNYRITNLRYEEDAWLLVMTKFERNPSQRWRKRPYFPGTDIEAGWKENFYVTEVSSDEREWVVVMDKKPSDYIDQKFKTRDYFPSDLINEYWNKGYNISSLRYLNNQWVLVMTKFSRFRPQLWRSTPDFPYKEIQENEERGYVLSGLSFGDGQWALVMTRR